jgi:hypothetical protein
MKTYERVWRYNSTILDLGIRWRWELISTLRPLYPRGKSPRYELYRRLGGPQSRSGSYEVEKNILALPENEPRPSNQQPVTIPTELSWLFLVILI